MSSRDAILASIRAHLPAGDYPAPEVPGFEDATDLRARFTKNLEAMGGKLLPASPDPLGQVQARLAGPAETCSMVPEIRGSRDLQSYQVPADLAGIEIAVIRAAFAVAETGSLCLTDQLLGINGLGYLPQHLIVLLDPDDILGNIHDAYRRPEWRQSNYAVLQTGPSATADIEGVLIHGAQGVRSLTVALVPRDGL